MLHNSLESQHLAERGFKGRGENTKVKLSANKLSQLNPTSMFKVSALYRIAPGSTQTTSKFPVDSSTFLFPESKIFQCSKDLAFF